VADAVGRGDLDELVRLVDGLAGAREWPAIVRLRDRCRSAMERGLQLWPAAEYAEYRLALDAPVEFAGPVVREGAGRFSLGPLWEVAASTHDWESLGPHLPDGPMRAMAAHERVLRGEDLTGVGGIDSQVLEIPLRLEPWEPAYPLASYRPDEADFPSPGLPPLQLAGMGEPGAEIDDEDAAEALYDLGRTWAEHSNGASAAAAVEGGAPAAIARLGYPEARIARVEPAEALAWMAWAAANGGAYGRRRGGPAGRFAAWWAAAMLVGLEWPPDPGELGGRAGDLEWHLWEPPGRVGGWSMHLAAADPDEGIAWAVAATDTHREDDPNRRDVPE
jgi:hypothetical protein